MTEIAAGVAVRHRTRPDMRGRVRTLLGPRALCTWVRRRLPSYVRLENLEPISDADLVASFHEREADALRPVFGVVGERTSGENRRFLLDGRCQPLSVARQAADAIRQSAWPAYDEPQGIDDE